MCDVEDIIYARRHLKPSCINAEEEAYLELVRNIATKGVECNDRTGVGTRSLLGEQLRFRLYRTGGSGAEEEEIVMPLLTTKRVFWRGVYEELLWFISGDTDARNLASKDVHFWDANGTREFLDEQGLTTYKEGTLGPVYGFQWRHFGATYRGPSADYTGQGVDQLAHVVEQIKGGRATDARRIILNAWNAADIDSMALPPCHVMSQFIVQEGRLSCLLTQRSADVGLGMPFNIASYALLTAILAHICDLKCGDLIATFGDTHVYKSHMEPLKAQCCRTPTAFPTLRFLEKVASIDDIKSHHFVLEGYKPQGPIKMPMAV